MNSVAGVTEYDAIARVMQHDIDGGRFGRVGDMKLGFQPEGTIFGCVGPDHKASGRLGSRGRVPRC